MLCCVVVGVGVVVSVGVSVSVVCVLIFVIHWLFERHNVVWCGLLSATLTALPVNSVFCRRLRLPIPLYSRTCRCGRLMDIHGAGVLGRKGFLLECAAVLVCRETGRRVSTNVFVRITDHTRLDGCRSIKMGQPAEGRTPPMEQRLRRTEVGHADGQARLSSFCKDFSQGSRPIQERVAAAWIRRWSCIFALSAAHAFATSLLERRPTRCTGNEVPSVQREVLRDARFVWEAPQVRGSILLMFECVDICFSVLPSQKNMIVCALENHLRSPNLEATAHAKAVVTRVHGFEQPDWTSHDHHDFFRLCLA